MKATILLLSFLAGAAFAGQVADIGRDGVGITVDAEPETVDVGRDFFLTVTVTSPAGKTAFLPDYGFAGSDSVVGTSVSGLLGSAIVAAVAAVICMGGGFFRRKKAGAKAYNM